jgi:hypothetical protein
MANRADLRDRFIRLVAKGHVNMATQAIDEATQRVSRYLATQLIVNTTFGALIAVGLYFIGLPNALLWGALAGLLRFVPYLGPLIGGMMPTLLAFAIFPGWREPLLALGLFIVIEILVANVLEPWAYGSRTGISPLAILVAAVFWTTLWGAVGLILSTPLTVCLVVLGRYVPQLGFLHIILGDEPVLPADSRFYQRLLGMDQQDAREVLDEYLKEHSLADLYDQVVIPALRMAKEDRRLEELDDAREHFMIDSISEFMLDLGAQQESKAPEGELPAFG